MKVWDQTLLSGSALVFTDGWETQTETRLKSADAEAKHTHKVSSDVDSEQISCLADFTGYIHNKLVMNLRGQMWSSNIRRRHSAVDDSAENPTAVQELGEEERNGKFWAPGQKHVGKLLKYNSFILVEWS